MDPPGIAPGSPTCDAGIFLLDDEPVVIERKPWDSNPQVANATGCVQDSVLIRPDDFRSQAAGAGIEPTSRRSERPVLPLDDPAEGQLNRHMSERVCSQKVPLSRNRTWVPTRRRRGWSFWFKARHHYQQRRPRISQERPAGIEPASQLLAQ